MFTQTVFGYGFRQRRYGTTRLKKTANVKDVSLIINTVDSRYLELGYLEFCEFRSVYLNKKEHFVYFLHGVGDIFTSPNYPKCKLICTSGNFNL